MPTRVITGGVGPIPGATMLERKLHFERDLDDLRLLLMREPRGHGAMSGAILQPPPRDDADWGVLFIEVSGCLPMCGHGTIGVATVLVETGHGRGDRAGDRRPPRRARPGWSRRACAVRGRPRARGDDPQRARFLHAARRDVEAGGRSRYDMAFGGNFYAIADAGVGRARGRPEHARRADRRRAWR